LLDDVFFCSVPPIRKFLALKKRSLFAQELKKTEEEHTEAQAELMKNRSEIWMFDGKSGNTIFFELVERR
jgi:DUF2075 family protein